MASRSPFAIRLNTSSDGMSGAAVHAGDAASHIFTFLARQLHQMPRFVDEEQVAGIVKILSLEVFCPELQLDFVVAHPTGVHGPLAEVQRNLLRWPEGQCHGLGRLGHCAW